MAGALGRSPLRLHGLSHAYASRGAAELLGAPPARLVNCQLGAGASLAAVRDGRSVETTMGFTPLEGLVMATRSGSVAPGLVLWVHEHAELAEAELARALEHDSGLLALGGTVDMHEAPPPRRPAISGRGWRSRSISIGRGPESRRWRRPSVGSTLAFTGGIGERSAPIRQEAGQGLEFLGVVVDESANAQRAEDREFGRRDAAACW